MSVFLHRRLSHHGYGTDIDSKDNLIACQMSIEEIRRRLQRIPWDISVLTE